MFITLLSLSHPAFATDDLPPVGHSRFDALIGNAPVPFPFAQLYQKIEAQMQAMTRQINEQMELLTQRFSGAGMSPEEIERIMAQARQVSERETTRAQEKMRRAQEKLERKLEAAQRQREKAADRRTRGAGRQSWSFDWPSPPPAPAPPKEPVSDEERLMILRMLEQKKITLEEAEQLLAALEDKE